jgi:hypothetical protein
MFQKGTKNFLPHFSIEDEFLDDESYWDSPCRQHLFIPFMHFLSLTTVSDILGSSLESYANVDEKA